MKRILAVLLTCVPTAAMAQAPAPVTAQAGDAALIQHCEGLIGLEQSYALARHWIDAWNSASPDAVMALYTPDFEMRAPGILDSPRISRPSGVLKGQADNRLRWFGANTTKATANFRLVEALAGVRSITVFYVGGNGRHITEIMEYTPDCRIERSNALYSPFPPGFARPPAAASAAARP